MNEPELAPAMADVAAWLKPGRKPTRREARLILVAIGSALLRGEEAAAAAALEQVATWFRAAPELWEEAVRSEIEMAATEHIRSVDPRWLTHPGYDLAYTVTARELLEARLTCAARLGHEPPEELLAAIERADLLLEPHLGGPGGATAGG